MEVLKNSERLAVIAQRFVRLLSIRMPVADAVEAMGVQYRIIEGLCQDQCLPEPCFRLRIIASCPQKSEVKHTLPFRCALLKHAGHVQRAGIIAQRLLELA